MLKLYRVLLHLYPTAFREEYAQPMEQEFRDELAEAQTGFSVLWLWMRLLFDLAVSLPVQAGERNGPRQSARFSALGKTSLAHGLCGASTGRRDWRQYRRIQCRKRAAIAVIAVPRAGRLGGIGSLSSAA